MQSKERGVRNNADAALLMKERIQADLRDAMRTRASLTVRALRALLTAIDNAQVVPAGDMHVRYRVRRFGDGSAEVPRVPLSEDDIRIVIGNELKVRYAAAEELERCGKAAAAAEAREEAAVITRYSKT